MRLIASAVVSMVIMCMAKVVVMGIRVLVVPLFSMEHQEIKTE